MDTLPKKLTCKLREWDPETADDVRQRVEEIIDFARQDELDLVRSRKAEREAPDLPDEPAPGEV